jgi:hypothetical protein
VSAALQAQPGLLRPQISNRQCWAGAAAAAAATAVGQRGRTQEAGRECGREGGWGLRLRISSPMTSMVTEVSQPSAYWWYLGAPEITWWPRLASSMGRPRTTSLRPQVCRRGGGDTDRQCTVQGTRMC